MNLKLKRLVRTTSSEQYAVFDLDQTDEEDQLPMTIGKLDLHYTAEGVYGTMLLWDDASRELRPSYRRAFIQVLLEDIIQPMGVPNEYVIEFFAPTLDLYEVFHNVELDDEADAEIDPETDEDSDGQITGNQAQNQTENRGGSPVGEPYAEYVEGAAGSAESGGRNRAGDSADHSAEESIQDKPSQAPDA